MNNNRPHPVKEEIAKGEVISLFLEKEEKKKNNNNNNNLRVTGADLFNNHHVDVRLLLRFLFSFIPRSAANIFVISFSIPSPIKFFLFFPFFCLK